ncbi:type II secretion system protein [Massilia sp. WF1]|uniref:type II secretion system F family protein n=1 Tax=unclassified Massilia TaxID=2609279 RepID=UPI00068CF7FC|nr:MULTISPECIES: type II secretion system F family protein [unclassified Massilia]ALK95234.1 type II secretion system protein [Massilia sp. WG5]KNZ67435.1 type II secretion system protein [Massilia sp. WF1]
MTSAQLFFLLIVFAVACGLVWLGMALFAPGALRERLANFMNRSEENKDGIGWIERVARVARPLTKLSIPEEGWEKSALRTRFMNAGWRNPAAPTLFFASKSALALALPAIVGIGLAFVPAPLVKAKLLFLLLLAATCGYYLPNGVLHHIVRRRKREIFETIPDALDLLTVCVEAGLSLERGLVKVAAEIHIKSVTLAQELQLVLMEMRTGFSKEKALRNFALRIGLDDVDSLVAMLIQSERFGTSVGDALRVYSENLRGKRRILAEEAAAKIGLKMLFPLIFCIFPTLMMVLLGPAGIQITRTFRNVLGAH